MGSGFIREYLALLLVFLGYESDLTNSQVLNMGEPYPCHLNIYYLHPVLQVYIKFDRCDGHGLPSLFDLGFEITHNICLLAIPLSHMTNVSFSGKQIAVSHVNHRMY